MRVGDFVTQVDHPRRIWQVVRVITPFECVPHATLECITDRKTTKFLSCQVLQDKRSFTPFKAEEFQYAAE